MRKHYSISYNSEAVITRTGSLKSIFNIGDKRARFSFKYTTVIFYID